VGVGSENPAKVEAVREALSLIGLEAEIIPVSVDPGVSNQPFCAETFYGARNRALKALRLTGADLSVGIEGGLCVYQNRLMGFAVVLPYQGREGTTSPFRPGFPYRIG